MQHHADSAQRLGAVVHKSEPQVAQPLCWSARMHIYSKGRIKVDLTPLLKKEVYVSLDKATTKEDKLILLTGEVKEEGRGIIEDEVKFVHKGKNGA